MGRLCAKVVDPMCNFASAKATQWVPLRVGTDGALALAMANVMVNDLGVYDAPIPGSDPVIWFNSGSYG